jgi:uncharacterized integral membrane protein
MQVLRWVVGSIIFLALLFLSLQNSELVTLKFYHGGAGKRRSSSSSLSRS